MYEWNIELRLIILYSTLDRVSSCTKHPFSIDSNVSFRMIPSTTAVELPNHAVNGGKNCEPNKNMTIRTCIDSFLDFELNEHYIGTVLGHSNRGRDAVQRGKIKKSI